jgi:hypothetical protein
MGWSFTGAIAADVDDYNYGLQAADVIAWTHHRKVESENFGHEGEFEPLRKLIEWKIEFQGRTKLHIPMEIPSNGVEFFAERMKAFIDVYGDLPSWKEILASHAKAQAENEEYGI